jgi:catechol 2,3-dioxygenase-like lactoylglutathione lyase family enzyme
MTCQLVALSIDANDPHRLARFWGAVLGHEVADDPAGGATLRPRDETEFRLRFVPAPDKRPGLGLGHLHLTSTSPEDQQETAARLIALGARAVDIGQRPEEGHLVLADPEGNDFCIIEPGNRYLAGCGFLAELTCDGSRAVGSFWSDVLGWPLVWDQGLQTAVQSPQGGPKISFDAEGMLPQAGQRGVHFHLAPPEHGDQQAEVDRLEALGAARIDIGQGEVSWVVMADPDGREFCVLPRATSDEPRPRARD